MNESSKQYEEEQIEEKYKKNSEYNEYLDELYGEIKVAEITFQPSRILFNLDPVAYDSGLRAFRQEKEEEFRDLVYKEFPTPIAYSFYRSEHGFENNIQRLHFLRDTWESIVFILYAFIIGEFNYLKFSMKDVNIKLNDIFSDKLATKLLIIERLLELGVKKNYELSFTNIVPLEIVKKIRELNDVRNEFSHSPALSEDEAGKIYSECFLDVFSVLRNLRNLKEIQLMHYVGQGGDYHNLRFEIFCGHSGTKTIKPIKISESQLTRSARYLNEKYLLVLNNEHIYSISPFLHFKKDERGHHTSICACKKRKCKDSTQILIFGILGLGGEYEQNFDDFQNEIAELDLLLSLNNTGGS